ncbi:hypothetical protein FRB95_000997 [Tulasnella sp. JGI-2019a]|nr:hypothetical protein FRB95_000997 [Tulasnella sp. JGI-2019a]
MPWNKEDKAFIPISGSYHSPAVPNKQPVIPKLNTPPPPPAPRGAVPPPPQNPSPSSSPPTWHPCSS